MQQHREKIPPKLNSPFQTLFITKFSPQNACICTNDNKILVEFLQYKVTDKVHPDYQKSQIILH